MKKFGLGCLWFIVIICFIVIFWVLFSIEGDGNSSRNNSDLDRYFRDLQQDLIDEQKAMQKSLNYDNLDYINDYYKENNINRRFVED